MAEDEKKIIVDDDWKAEVSFEENLQRFEQSNKIRKSVMEIVYKAIEIRKQPKHPQPVRKWNRTPIITTSI